ncbi:phage tail protein [Paenibacillus cymbidii]|uniref:phage tail protein n=1 Tax=Paenibacillus cymbidii TaxID=1639034 RepID=UPI0010808410|nr:tail fiber protein [Paenibacillus cymbidii]
MSDQYLGEIRMFSGNYAPQGWALCNGQLLPINQNEALYALLGTTYGGDGRSTFGLPDLQGRVPVHMGKNPVTGTAYPLGQKAGTETVTLEQSMLPAHTHPVGAQQLAGNSTSPANNIWATSTNKVYADTAPNGQMDPATISSIGGNQPHNNMMPFSTVTFIIALQGNYPSQG